MLKLNANDGSQQDAYMNIKQQRQELALRILLNNLTSDFKSAGTAPQQDSIRSQIERLVSSMGEGKSFSEVTGQDSSIFNKNQAPTAQQTAANTFNKPAANAAAPKAESAKTGGTSKSSLSDRAPIADLEQALSGEDLEYAKKINGGHDKLGGRSENEVLNTGLILYDLKDEMGMENIGEGEWFKAGANNDKINWYADANGNGQIDESDKNIDGDTSYLTPGGKYIDPSKADFLMEVDSEKYGKVVISVGGDGNLNGADDAIMSMGGKTAAGNMEAGLKNATAPKDNTAATTEKATETKTATPKAAEEAKAVTKAPQVAQKAEANPVLGKLVDQVEDPASLTDSNIKDLIAAIMLLINSNQAA